MRKLHSKKAIISFLTIGTLACPRAVPAQTITFDDLNPDTMPGHANNEAFTAPIPNGYAGLQWNNFWVTDVTEQLQSFPGETGYKNSVVSGANVIYNYYGNPGLIAASSFNLNSAYLTAAWNNGLQVEVQGFVGSTLTYDNTYTINTTGPTLLNFNYLGVDEVNFISSGGTPAGFGVGEGTQFAMDNMTISGVPEPTTLALAGLGGVVAVVFARRRKT